jgi:hypothetical protein
VKKIKSSKTISTCWLTGYLYVQPVCAANSDTADQIKQESDKSLYKASLEAIKTSIKTSTSSMTAVPKPLKFLRPHYEKLEKAYESWPAGEDKVNN